MARLKHLAKTGPGFNFADLRRLYIYIILIVLALYNTPLHQFCKIPLLVHHYQQHHERNSSIGFFQFLNMHYLGHDDDDDDDEEDRQLPFKETNAFVLHQLFTTGTKSFVIQKITVDISMSFPIDDHSLLPTPHVAELFRPPQA